MLNYPPFSGWLFLGELKKKIGRIPLRFAFANDLKSLIFCFIQDLIEIRTNMLAGPPRDERGMMGEGWVMDGRWMGLIGGRCNRV